MTRSRTMHLHHRPRRSRQPSRTRLALSSGRPQRELKWLASSRTTGSLLPRCPASQLQTWLNWSCPWDKGCGSKGMHVSSDLASFTLLVLVPCARCHFFQQADSLIAYAMQAPGGRSTWQHQAQAHKRSTQGTRLQAGKGCCTGSC